MRALGCWIKPRTRSDSTLARPFRIALAIALVVLLFASPAWSQTSPEQLIAQVGQRDLFTGSATLGVPVEVPPGTAGFTPRIALRYSSQSVDQLQPRAQAQIGGLGWNLHAAPYIHRDTKGTSSFYDDTIWLVFDGVRYELLKRKSYEGSEYEPTWYYRPKDGGPIFHIWWVPFDDDWTVITKDGTSYRFGATTASRAISTLRWYPIVGGNPVPIPYRYMATWVGHRGGHFWFSYSRQQATASNGLEYTRAIYLDRITYTHASIEFGSHAGGWGYYPGTTTGPLREILFLRAPRADWTDTTATTGTSFHETERLDRIEVRVDGALVTKYVLAFDYSTDRDTGYTWQGGAAGDLTLRSVTQYGTDGFTTLPAQTFDYDGRLLRTTRNSIGGSLTFTYERVTSVTPNRSRVMHRRITDGRASSSDMQVNYSYAGLLMNGSEFGGHASVRADGPGDASTQVWFHQEVTHLGRPHKIEIRDRASNALFTRVDTVWTRFASTDYAGTGFVAPTQIDVYTYDGDATSKQTRRTHMYDAYGNVTETHELGDVNRAGDERTTIVTWATDRGPYTEGDPDQDTPYIVDRPGHRVVKDGAGNPVAEEWFYYNSYGSLSYTGRPATGDVLRHCRWLSTGISPCEDYEYLFDYGLPERVVDARGNMTTFTYEDSFAFLHTITTPPTPNAPAGLVTTLEHDLRFGVPLSATDTNGRTTTYSYDVFGRRTSKTDPLGNSIVTEYNSFGTVGTQRITTWLPDSSPNGGLWHQAYFDGLGRVFWERKEAVDGANGLRSVSVNVDFDSGGLVSRRSLPYFQGATTYWTTFAYDPLGRPRVVTFPQSPAEPVAYTEQFTYNEWTTTFTDRAGRSRTFARDAHGRMETVTEPGGAVTRYAYSALGQLREVTDAAGNATSITYDTLGRKTRLDDPDTGTWTYEYDANGNLIRQTDAKGQVLVFDEYDSLNRPTTKRYPDGRRIRWSYDTGTDGKGRLAKAEALDAAGAVTGSTAYLYDSLGRTTRMTRVIDGTSYDTQLTYTAIGQLETLTYPDGERLTYTYDEGGHLTRLVGLLAEVTQTYVNSIDYNAAGQPIYMVLGAQTIARRLTYDPATLRLSGIEVANEAGTVLENLSYAYDPIGNVKKVTDLRNPARTLTLGYDALDRLTSSGWNGSTYTYAYNAIGNMTYRAGKTFGYGETSRTCNRLMPHAMTSQSNGRTYSYDCNGNMTRDYERTFTWDPDNRLVSVTRTNVGTTRLTYGPDGPRVKKVGPSKTVRYAHGYEDHVTDGVRIKHIVANGARVATRVTGATQNAGVYFVLKDHLGSLSVLTNDTGTEMQRLYYTPYGTADGNEGSVDFDTLRYAGQRLDPEIGIYDYGARFYDPYHGRFISADPLVPRPYDPQSLNRYSYALNNPARFTDPTGLDCCDSDDRGAREANEAGESPGTVGMNGDPADSDGLVVVACHQGCRVIDGKVYHTIGPANPASTDENRSGIGDPGYTPDDVLASVDALETTLDVLGLVPGIGEAFDAANVGLNLFQGDYSGAALSAAAMVPGIGMAATGAKFAGRAAVLTGRAGEVAHGIDPSGLKAAFEVMDPLTGRVWMARPDEVTIDMLKEVKFRTYVAWTSQLRAYFKFAQETGRSFVLGVRSDTKVSKTVKDLKDAGLINVEVP